MQGYEISVLDDEGFIVGRDVPVADALRHRTIWRIKMKFVNLTPHDLHIADVDGDFFTIKSSGVARLDTSTIFHKNLDHVPFFTTVFGRVQGLPDYEADEDYIYITSMLVAQTVKRGDVVSPGELVRDKEGNVIGCRGLTAWL